MKTDANERRMLEAFEAGEWRGVGRLALPEFAMAISHGQRFAAFEERREFSGQVATAPCRRTMGTMRAHHVPVQYSAADLEDDLRTQRELGILPSR